MSHTLSHEGLHSTVSTQAILYIVWTLNYSTSCKYHANITTLLNPNWQLRHRLFHKWGIKSLRTFKLSHMICIVRQWHFGCESRMPTRPRMHHLADSSQTQLCTACLEISPASSGFTTGSAKHNNELTSGRGGCCTLTAQMNLLAATEGKKKSKTGLWLLTMSQFALQ